MGPSSLFEKHYFSLLSPSLQVPGVLRGGKDEDSCQPHRQPPPALHLLSHQLPAQAEHPLGDARGLHGEKRTPLSSPLPLFRLLTVKLPQRWRSTPGFLMKRSPLCDPVSPQRHLKHILIRHHSSTLPKLQRHVICRPPIAC